MELEHETFRNAKMVNLYKASVLKKVGLGRAKGASGAEHAHGLRKDRAAFVFRGHLPVCWPWS